MASFEKKWKTTDVLKFIFEFSCPKVAQSIKNYSFQCSKLPIFKQKRAKAKIALALDITAFPNVV